MHWILNVSEDFSLSGIINISQWLLLPPYAVGPSAEYLLRVEQLTSGHTVLLKLWQNPAGLVLQASERLNGLETEELSRKARRMLRLDDNLARFLRKAHKTPALHAAVKHGGIFLRGATLFEDFIKALVLASSPEDWGRQRITWLVDRLGAPLPSNPTHHAFPTPQQLLWGKHLLREMLPLNVSECICDAAEIFYTKANQLEGLTRSDLPLMVVDQVVRHLLGLEDYAHSLFMLALGRYDYIPTDSHTCQRLERAWEHPAPITPEAVIEAFSPWKPWGGLAYWLWDWQVEAVPVPWQGELVNGNFAN